MRPLVRLGAAALAGAVLVGAPIHQARAASEHAATAGDDDDAPLTELRERLGATRRDASEQLRGLLTALARTMERVQEARAGVERIVTFDHELASFDAASEEPASDEPAEPTEAQRGRPRRLEYVEDTNDPLAGL